MTTPAPEHHPPLVDAQEQLTLLPLRGIPEVKPGDDLAALIAESAARSAGGLQNGDVLVVAQKVVSKAENCLVNLEDVEPSAFAREWAERWNKDARQVEIVLRESVRIVKMDNGVMVTETRHGFICANSGVDASNVGGHGVLCLLPPDPDASARGLRAAFRERQGVDVAVIISDTFGRPWRESLTNIAIGIAGIAPIRDYIGLADPYEYELRVTTLCDADELAGAAELVMGKVAAVPAAIVRGFAHTPVEDVSSHQLVRPKEKDLFR